MKNNRKVIQQVSVGAAFITLCALLFWLLPFLVWKNYLRTAERLNKLPGISPTGGFKSAIAVTIYLFFSVTLFVTLAVVGGMSVASAGFDIPSEEFVGADTPTDEDGDSEQLADTSTPEETPNTESTSENDTDADSAATPTETPAYDTDAVAEDVEHPQAVEIGLYEQKTPTHLESGAVTLVDETGVKVETKRFSNGNITFTGLTPGTNYTLDVESWKGDSWSNESPTFDPGQTDSVRAEVIPFKFAGATEFDFQIRTIPHSHLEAGEIKDVDELLESKSQRFVQGTYADGGFELEWGTYARWEGERFTDGLHTINGSNEEGVQEDYALPDSVNQTGVVYNPLEQPAFEPVIAGVHNLQLTDERDQSLSSLPKTQSQTFWEIAHEETTTLDKVSTPQPLRFESHPLEQDQREVYVLQATPEGYSDWVEEVYSFDTDDASFTPRLYVDAETGYVLRWEAPVRLSTGVDPFDEGSPLTSSVIVIDFWNHDEVDSS